MTRRKVMISSTARDMPGHRQILRDACERAGFEPNMMEKLPALDAEAIQASLRMVDEADVYVGVFAYRYGYVPKGHDISIAEMEYDRAVDLKKPRLIFFMDKTHPITVEDLETGPGEIKLQVLKDRIEQQGVEAFFKSPGDLKGDVIAALTTLGRKLDTAAAVVSTAAPAFSAKAKIVISYRRADSPGTAGRILDRLTGRYGKDSVFIDIDNIPAGVDFRQHIRNALEDCDIMLAIVGRKWLGPIARGRKRINEQSDIVRLEIETALQNGIAIIPVLIDGATMPKAAQLPDSLQDFTFRNAAVVDTGRDFHRHVDQMIASMDSSLKAMSSKLAPTKRGRKTR
jgi:hypothetical protein